MDGILLVNKDKNMTSRDVVNFLVDFFGEKKIGHFGTLDPLATGLLVVGIGAYTKAQVLFSDESKEYEVEVLVGRSTDTYDITGTVLEENYVNVLEKDLVDCLNSFVGSYNQEVPIYSAVKKSGRKLYEYARSGEGVSLPSRIVNISSLSFSSLYERDGNTYFSFTCSVSKGTYIRSLVNDISKKLGVPMCMSNLRRTRCGCFSIDDSYTLNEVKSDNFSLLSACDFLDVDVMEITSDLEKLVLNGSEIDTLSDKYILFTKSGVDIVLYGPFGDKMKPYLTFKK